MIDHHRFSLDGEPEQFAVYTHTKDGWQFMETCKEFWQIGVHSGYAGNSKYRFTKMLPPYQEVVLAVGGGETLSIHVNQATGLLVTSDKPYVPWPFGLPAGW